jgi:phosphatidylglycerophosphate synthase
MSKLLTGVKNKVRAGMRQVARALHQVSGGRVTPKGVTWFGFAMHIPIAILIGQGEFVLAAIGLVVFGLFDTLDGELARLTKRSSPGGMLLDASTDRMKEVLLYAGIAYYFAAQGFDPRWIALAVIALGASMSVSYVKAKGEAAVASGKKEIDHYTLNRMFADGLLTFEIRMTLVVLGLLFNQLDIIVVIIAVGATITAFQRLFTISRSLR